MIRCCGSMLCTTFGNRPKKPLSKASTRSMKPPHLLRLLLVSTLGSPQYARQSHRSGGTSEILALRSIRLDQKPCASSAPGKRNDIPTIATSIVSIPCDNPPDRQIQPFLRNSIPACAHHASDPIGPCCLTTRRRDRYRPPESITMPNAESFPDRTVSDSDFETSRASAPQSRIERGLRIQLSQHPAAPSRYETSMVVLQFLATVRSGARRHAHFPYRCRHIAITNNDISIEKPRCSMPIFEIPPIQRVTH